MPKVEFFCFWECSKIGMDLTRENGDFIISDLTLEQAKDLVTQLQDAIAKYEECEEGAREYFGEE